MTGQDLIELAFFNLRRTKLRTLLTTLGVIIGIGALVSMISFGTGMQKNVNDSLKQNDLFTSLFVSTQKIDIRQMAQGDLTALNTSRKDTLQLNDAALKRIQNTPGVQIAYPEVRFPIQLIFREKDIKTEAQAIPVLMKHHAPFKDLAFGRFYENNQEAGVLLKWNALTNLGFRLVQTENLSQTDTLKNLCPLTPEEIIGQEIQIVTTVPDMAAILQAPWKILQVPMHIPFKQDTTTLPVVGILKQENNFTENRFRGLCILPFATAQSIPRMAFSSVHDLLGSTQGPDTYHSLYVRTVSPEQLQNVRDAIDALGFHTFSILDEMEEIKKAFLIFDSMLGAVGTIALIVAALGIINTMIMSILERTREIGVMKAIGASDREIKMLFFVEAGVIGIVGGVAGIGLGYAATAVANVIANIHLKPMGQPDVDFFYIPFWLIAGAIAFSVLISLIAGLYPASRAARIDPVKALRHD